MPPELLQTTLGLLGGLEWYRILELDMLAARELYERARKVCVSLCANAGCGCWRRWGKGGRVVDMPVNSLLEKIRQVEPPDPFVRPVSHTDAFLPRDAAIHEFIPSPVGQKEEQLSLMSE